MTLDGGAASWRLAACAASFYPANYHEHFAELDGHNFTTNVLFT
jgi:hypothetical protein